MDEVLRAGSLRQMDFATRNLYRTAIEELSRGATLDELQVTTAALDAGRDAAAGEQQRDPGYWLIAAGRREFEIRIGYRPRVSSRPIRWFKRHGAGAYVGAILLLTGMVLGAAFA